MTQTLRGEDFLAGQRVAHISVGDGTVISNDGKTVCVTFDRLTRSSKPIMGEYPYVWFEQHPNWIFHRTNQGQSQ